MKKIRIGLMGFGEIARHLYRLCLKCDNVEVVAISDIGKPEILHYLLQAEARGDFDIELEGNFLISNGKKSRFIRGIEPGDVPWDVFDVDFVVDATGKYRSKVHMEKHIKAGAKRVILASLPDEDIDRVVLMGVNDHTINAKDKLISAGSATTIATAIMLRILDDAFGVDYAMLTTVHSYTSDQALRDRAGTDFRRSRSAAENIIPNDTPSPKWIQKIMPEFKGRVEGSALNVPVPNGSLLDLTTILHDPTVTVEMVGNAFAKAAKTIPDLVEVVVDPIVSTDVIGNTRSVVYDKKATMKSPGRMVKTLTWYHTELAMAARVLDVILAYSKIDKKGGLK